MYIIIFFRVPQLQVDGTKIFVSKARASLATYKYFRNVRWRGECVIAPPTYITQVNYVLTNGGCEYHPYVL